MTPETKSITTPKILNLLKKEPIFFCAKVRQHGIPFKFLAPIEAKIFLKWRVYTEFLFFRPRKTVLLSDLIFRRRK